MKIGIEAQRLFRKKKHGMDMVALELIRHLQQIDRENEYYVFVRPDEDNTVIQETANFRIVELKGGPYPYWEQVLLPRAAVKYGCDILHCTSNTAPLFCSVPLVLTLHDIIFMEDSVWGLLKGKGSYYQKFGNIYRRLLVPGLLKKCRSIITVSDFEKERIASFFNLENDNRLVTVYNGASAYFRPVTDAAELQKVKEQYGLPERFFFFLGNTHPKKNTKGTLQAFSTFIRQSKSDMKLVMLDYDRNALTRLLAEIGDPELMDRIVLTGYVHNQDLPAIYSLCTVFLYPSLRESFGIPIIEAMACKAPVITSNTSSMPEVAGNAAILVNPFDPLEITAAMTCTYKNVTLRSDMGRKGMQQATLFSWQQMAQKVHVLYQETASYTAPLSTLTLKTL